MKKSLLTLAVIAAVCLSACATTEPLVKYKYIGDEVPDSLVQDCAVSAPPAKSQYSASTAQQKEALLSRALGATYKDLADCNGDKAALRDWKAQQARLRADAEAAKPQ